MLWQASRWPCPLHGPLTHAASTAAHVVYGLSIAPTSHPNHCTSPQVPAAFLAAVQAAQAHPVLGSTWLQAVPLPARVQGFFKPTAAAILQRLRAQPCLRTAGGGLATPAQVLRAPAALQALLPEPALLAGSGHLYLWPELEASEVRCRAAGVLG